MKRIIFLVSMAASPAFLLGQQPGPPSTLTVMGTAKHVEAPLDFRIWFVLEENSNKCDPIKGMVTLEELEQDLLDAARSKGLDIGPVESMLVAGNTGTYFRKKKIGVWLPDLQSAEIFKAFLLEQGFWPVEIKAHYTPMTAVIPDDVALEAIRDARRQAAWVAEIQGKKVSNVLGLTEREFISDSFVIQPDEGCSNDSYFLDSFYYMWKFQPARHYYDNINEGPLIDRQLTYTLLVTFLLE